MYLEEEYLMSLFAKNISPQIYAQSTYIHQNVSPFIKYFKDRLKVKYMGKGLIYTDAAVFQIFILNFSVQGNKPALKDYLIYYYEVKIMDIGQRGDMCIGFADSQFPSNKMPGMTKNSFGYKSDGKLFTFRNAVKQQFQLEKKIKTYTTNDIIGCGLNFIKKEIFFSLNGNIIIEQNFQNVDLSEEYYPTVGLHSLNQTVKFNFGKKKFQLDIQKIILNEKKALIQQVLNEQISNYNVHQIVLQYLYFNGYMNTLQIFEKEINIDENQRYMLKDLMQQGNQHQLEKHPPNIIPLLKAFSQEYQLNTQKNGLEKQESKFKNELYSQIKIIGQSFNNQEVSQNLKSKSFDNNSFSKGLLYNNEIKGNNNNNIELQQKNSIHGILKNKNDIIEIEQENQQTYISPTIDIFDFNQNSQQQYIYQNSKKLFPKIKIANKHQIQRLVYHIKKLKNQKEQVILVFQNFITVIKSNKINNKRRKNIKCNIIIE